MTQHQLDKDWQARFKDQWRKAVLYDHNLNNGAKAVGLATLEDYNRDSPERVGTTWNKASTLAAKMGCTEKTVRTGWNALREAGYLHSLGRMSGGRSVYIHRFDLPEEGRAVKVTGQSGKSYRADRKELPGRAVKVTDGTKGTYQGERNKETEQDESYIGSCPVEHDPQSFDDDPIDISFFIEEEEPQRREELINYWAAVATDHECPHTYATVRELFIDQMRGKNRTHWGGTFMSAMKTFIDPDMCEMPEYDIWHPDALNELPAPDHSVDELLAGWVGRQDRPQEFRKVWERALLAGHDPVHVIAVGASDHSVNLYPRELLDLLHRIAPHDRAVAVGRYRAKTVNDEPPFRAVTGELSNDQF